MTSLLRPLLAALFGLSLGLGVAALSGESPLRVLQVLFLSAFGSPYDFGMTLFYTAPMLLTGLSVALAFHAGLFNVGAEGQLMVGTLAAAAVGALFPGLPFPLAPALTILAAFGAGALWGAIPGYLRARRGSHEVINTILMNFIASALCSWVTLYFLRNPGSQNPETVPIPAHFEFQKWAFADGAPLSFAIPLAFSMAFGVWFYLNQTVLGFQHRAVGQSERAAKASGISIARMQVLAMGLAGGMAGLVALPEVLGNVGKFRLSFSPGYGFTGIAVALLARNHPLGILFSAFLFGALHKGAGSLDMETERVSRDLSQILQALIVLSVAAEGLWDRVVQKRKKVGGA